MIIIRLKGGLGNQLFQYALGRSLSHKNNTELKFDVSFFKNNKYRAFSLQNFNIAGAAAGLMDIPRLKFLNLFDSSKPYFKRHVISERGFSFDPKISDAADGTYLDGYWQSEKYFKESSDLIRREIALKEVGDSNYLDLLDDIRNSNSVSLHVRRTDYLSPKNKNIYAICAPDYYRQAIDLIAEKIGDLKIFVFSDDPDWVKANINLSYPARYISSPKKSKNSDCQEIILMSSCKHNITANSTYSWWGAWLNNNPDKIVVTPKKWFLIPSLTEDDLIPFGWIRI